MHGEFSSLSFPKKGKEIKGRVELKVAENKAKLDEKEIEIKKMAKEFDLDIVKLLMDLDSLRGMSNRAMPSQEMDKLQSLAHRIDALKKENAKLGLVLRNLPDGTEFNLTFSELEYFAF